MSNSEEVAGKSKFKIKLPRTVYRFVYQISVDYLTNLKCNVYVSPRTLRRILFCTQDNIHHNIMLLRGNNTQPNSYFLSGAQYILIHHIANKNYVLLQPLLKLKENNYTVKQKFPKMSSIFTYLSSNYITYKSQVHNLQ